MEHQLQKSRSTPCRTGHFSGGDALQHEVGDGVSVPQCHVTQDLQGSQRAWSSGQNLQQFFTNGLVYLLSSLRLSLRVQPPGRLRKSSRATRGTQFGLSQC